MSLKMNIVRCP